MKKYSLYKPSSVEWIGEIPEHWVVGRVKYLVDRSKYYQIGDGDHGSIKPEMYCENGIPYIRVQNLNWNGLITKDGLVHISEETHKRNQKSKLIENDILIAKTGATIGKLGLVDKSIGESNTTSSVGKITIDKKRFTPKYFLYFFQSNFFQKMIWVKGIEKSAQPGFNIDDLVDFPVLILELSEQLQIVQFLDEKTELIDKLILTKERKIDLLKQQRTSLINEVITKGLKPDVKMKDSGVEWVGEIPENWNVLKLKNISELRISSVDKHILENENQVRVCNYTDVYYNEFISSKINFKNGSCSDDELQKYTLNNGDVIITKDSESPNDIGVPSIVVEDIDNLVCGYHLSIIKPKVSKMIGGFLFRQLQTKRVRNYYEVCSNGITRFGLGKSSVLETPLIVPTIKEQQQIVEFLDTRTKEIDDLISKEKKKIDLLKEYRQSLISEVITGKIDVRTNLN